jgi:hypothetical protein
MPRPLVGAAKRKKADEDEAQKRNLLPATKPGTASYPAFAGRTPVHTGNTRVRNPSGYAHVPKTQAQAQAQAHREFVIGGRRVVVPRN